LLSVSPFLSGVNGSRFERKVGDGSHILVQSQLDTNYFIGLAVFVLCQAQTLYYAATL